jgi:two-component system, sensor histidine kinase and response regulator
MENPMGLAKKSAHILIADDTPGNIEMLENILVQENHTVHSVADGSEVLAYVLAHKIDLIFLDIRMPHQSGIDTCRQLKAHTKTEEIPVIMITASNKKEDIIKSFEAGAVDYVTYPYESLELISRMRSHLRSHFLYQDLKFHTDENTRLKREQEQFIRHELKNLLTPIQGYAEILRFKNDLDGANSQYVDHIHQGTQKFLTFIDQLKQLQDLENGDVKIKKESWDLVAMVKKHIEMLGTGNITTTLELPCSLILTADRNLIEMALHALIKNAFEHIAKLEDLDQRAVSISIRSASGTLTIEITNLGPSLSPARCQTFFQKFNSEDKPGSLGLGTTYAYWIVKVHGGDISVSSDKNLGTTVRLTLPHHTQ